MQRLDDNLKGRLAIAAVGFMPIGALAIAFSGQVSLQTTALGVVVPVWLAVAAIAVARPAWGRLLALALLAGMAATFFYDIARLAMTWAAGLTDGIPNIGRLLIGDMNAPTTEAAALGYFYRYLGDGGGLALAFAMGGMYGVRRGMAFGAFVCTCLWATLLVMPYAQTLLFPLTPYAMAMTMIGHLVYGGVLGGLLARWLPVEAAAPAPKTLTLTVTEATALPAVKAEATA
jgi:hypothetical protein